MIPPTPVRPSLLNLDRSVDRLSVLLSSGESWLRILSPSPLLPLFLDRSTGYICGLIACRLRLLSASAPSRVRDHSLCAPSVPGRRHRLLVSSIASNASIRGFTTTTSFSQAALLRLGLLAQVEHSAQVKMPPLAPPRYLWSELSVQLISQLLDQHGRRESEAKS